MNVFISNIVPQEAITLLEQQGHDVTVHTGSTLSEDDIITNCRHKDALLYAGSAKLTENFFKQCAHLKGVALMSAGYDHVDLAMARKYRIPVSNTRDVLSKATADIAFLLMLAVSRNAFYLSQKIRNNEWHDWNPTENLGIELYGKTLGIFGLGRIGYELAVKARSAYDMKIIYHNRSPKPHLESTLNAQYTDFETLLQQSDVISVHANLSAQTAGKFNSEAFRKMKSTAIFINTARGGLHQEKELINALTEKEIWGAGLDVTNPEPMHPDNPLLTMPNVCVLPHIGSATAETRTAMATMAARNIIAVLSGDKMPQEITVR
jgi:glyoxylate reductase